ncbi:MAG: metal-dependent hydrolase [Candidatus Aenigmarchaeota archaeon]|nr:metal-dependent hydrolase [Candidatus Aenigmarchaeota archaeon]
MPITPFHWSVLALGFLVFNSLYLPALAISSVIMDIEPAYYMFISPRADGLLHGFFHTYIGVTIIGLLVGFVLVRFRKNVDRIMGFLKIPQQSISNRLVYVSSLLAAFSHVFLDSFMHSDMKPFYPLQQNPFLGLVSTFDIYLLTGIVLLSVPVLYLIKVVRKA